MELGVDTGFSTWNGGDRPGRNFHDADSLKAIPAIRKDPVRDELSLDVIKGPAQR